MYKYKYVEVEVRNLMGVFTYDDHRELIDKFALGNYRFVGYIPKTLNSHGVIKSIDLIFEKEVENL